MSDTPVKIVVDLSKPEGDPEREQIIPLTAKEIADLEATRAKFEQEKIAFEAEQAEKEAAKESAKSKLAALGLSDTEIAALLG